MIKYIKNHFLTVVVLILLVIVLVQRCTDPKPINPGTTIVRDTSWIHKDSTVYVKPQIIERIPVPVNQWIKEKEYYPDTNYAKLVIQYQTLVSKYLESVVYRDSLKIDTFGYVKVTDTVSKNSITARSYSYHLKYPVIKETITIYPKPKNQIYIGGGLAGNSGEVINQINAGFLLKNKKDQIFGINGGFDHNGNLLIGVSSYWKITFKHK